MIDNNVNKKSYLSQATELVKTNIRNIIIILSLCFVLFLSFQIYSVYSSYKIKNNSITFFKIQNIEDTSIFKENINNLSNEKNFYGALSQLELIKISIKNKNIDKAIDEYSVLFENKNLNGIYRSAIASNASYQLIDLNLNNLSLNYLKIIKKYISYIDDELQAYSGIKLELNYLLKVLEIQKNNLDYKNFDQANEIYEDIMNSEVSSTAIKERVNKIHEFFIYK